MVLTCVYLLGCFLIGYATVALLYRSRSTSWLFTVSLAIPLGCLVVGLLLFYLALAGIRPCRSTIFVADATAICIIAWLCYSKQFEPPRWPKNRQAIQDSFPWILLPLAIAGYVGITALRIATTTPLVGWDAWAVWLFSAKILSAEHLIPAPWIFSSPAGLAHPHYPLLWPMLAAGAYGFAGRIDDHYARAFLVFLWVGWGMMTYVALRWKLASLPAAMIAALQLCLPILAQYATNGYADVMLAGFYGAMIYLILRLSEKSDWPTLISAALLGTAVAFTKQEGMPLACFAAVLVLAMAARNGLKRALRLAATFLGIIFSLLVPWLIWSRDFPRNDENYGSHLWAVLSAANLHRLPEILSAIESSLTNLDTWGPLWLLLVIIAAIGWRGFRLPHIQALWALLAAQFLLYIFAYIISPDDLSWLIATALDRLIIHITPVAILLIGYHWAAVPAKGND
jgi:hypothetical protein